MIKLFWHPRTRAVRVAWMLEEAGVPYQRVLVDIKAAEPERDPAFLAASPMGKVPALEDGAVRLADSAAICMYLADRYPDRRLAPGLDDPRRGMYLFWMVYSPGVIEPAMSEKFAGGAPNRHASGWGGFRPDDPHAGERPRARAVAARRPVQRRGRDGGFVCPLHGHVRVAAGFTRAAGLRGPRFGAPGVASRDGRGTVLSLRAPLPGAPRRKRAAVPRAKWPAGARGNECPA